jgi:hypothetical protein
LVAGDLAERRGPRGRLRPTGGIFLFLFLFLFLLVTGNLAERRKATCAQ